MSSSRMGTTAGQPRMTGATGQTGTGASNIVYDVVSVLYHSLESASTTQQYIRDAQQAGNNDLVNFFQQVEKVNRQCADQAQQLLAQQLQNQPSH